MTNITSLYTPRERILISMNGCPFLLTWVVRIPSLLFPSTTTEAGKRVVIMEKSRDLSYFLDSNKFQADFFRYYDLIRFLQSHL